jgi:Zn-dependent peptidase ImmA (M78 family)
MAPSTPAFVEPAVLRWARESIGLTPLAAARKIKVPDDRVTQWESGAVRPTVTQLRSAAAVYKRPLGVFFLPSPPSGFDAMREFRTLPGTEAGEWSPALHAEYRRAELQREFALELAEIEDDPPSTAWLLETSPEDEEEIAAAARARLLERAPRSLPRGSGDPYQHLNAWVAALEEVGILVLTTMRGGVSTQEMRAFSLYYEALPVIMVNGGDAAHGRLFSLLHEYAHLLLHSSGLCDVVTDLRATTPDRRLEARCNSIAAAILLPRDAVLAHAEVRARESRPDTWDYESLRLAATSFGVSAEAFLRRLVTLGRASREFYQLRRDEFLSAYDEDEVRGRATGGGNWYRNTARDLGKAAILS